MTSNLPGPTMPNLNKRYILDLIRERKYCEVTQMPLVIDETYLVRVLSTDEELVVTRLGLERLFVDPEDMIVISGETGMPVA